MKKTGELDALGGQGQMATFIVSPSDRGFLRLQSVHDQAVYLAVRQGRLDKGPGGQACDLVLTPSIPGSIVITHAHGHGAVAFDQGGHPCDPRQQLPNPAFAQFQITPA